MGASSKNASETNANQAALATQQKQTESQILTFQQQNDAKINADLGTGLGVSNPPNMPSVAAVIGPSESTFMQRLTPNAQATSQTEAAAAIDPNEVGLLTTFANSAQGTNATIANEVQGTAAQLEQYGTISQPSTVPIAGSQPLGPQVSAIPVNPTTTATGGSSAIFFVGVGIVGLVAFLYFEHSKKEPPREAAA